MTDFNNNDLNQDQSVQQFQQAAQQLEQAAAAVQPAPAADPFQAEPPQAPQPETPVYQQPNYTQQYAQQQYGQQQYQQPQYGGQQYQQPQQPYGQQPYQQPVQQKVRYDVPPQGYVQKSRIAAGLLAILFGVFGIHNFYLGNNTKAVIQLVVTLVGSIITCGIASIGVEIWALIEGIQILSANKPDYNYDANGVILKD